MARCTWLIISLCVLSVSLCTVDGQSESLGPIRLYNNGNTDLGQSQGIVQVYVTENAVVDWTNVCVNTATAGTSDMKRQADVICHQLGYTEAVSYSTAGKENYGTDPAQSLIKGLQCDSKDLLVIHQCDYTVSNSSCANSMDMTVNCSTKRLTDDPFDTMVRIVDGPDVREGRVEVYCSGEWGTVCSKSNDADLSGFADLVCQQLGYSTAGTWNHVQLSGASNQSIWMKDVTCPLASSNYDCLSNCQKCPSRAISSCNHTSDMTIRCVSDRTAPDTKYETETCRYDNGISIPTGEIVGVVIGFIVACLVCTALLVLIPTCIYCYCRVKRVRVTLNQPTNYANFE